MTVLVVLPVSTKSDRNCFLKNHGASKAYHQLELHSRNTSTGLFSKEALCGVRLLFGSLFFQAHLNGDGSDRAIFGHPIGQPFHRRKIAVMSLFTVVARPCVRGVASVLKLILYALDCVNVVAIASSGKI